MRVFPKGIPVIASVDVTAIVDKKDLAALLPKIIDRVPSLGGIEVFPYGIPVPDLYSVNVNLR